MKAEFTLAIVAPTFDRPSETFIRDHVRGIAPGRTVLICARDAGTQNLDCRVFSGVPPSLSPSQRWVSPARVLDVLTVGMTRGVEDKLVQFLRENGVTHLLAEYLTTAIHFGRAARRAGIPLYAHAHGYDASQALRSPKTRLRYYLLSRNAKTIFVPSQFLAEKLVASGLPREKLVVSPYGVDETLFVPTSRQPGRVVAVGRFVEKKAPEITLRSFAQALEKHTLARLDMIGDGPLLKPCRHLAEQLGIVHAVEFHGAQPPQKVRELLGVASVFVQHSVTANNGDTEGLPVAILEAMASALPVVATWHSGIPEVVIDGQTGKLVGERDVSGMACALSTLLTNKDAAQSLGEAGRKRALQFTMARSIERLRQYLTVDGKS